MKISKEDAKIFDFLSPIHIERKQKSSITALKLLNTNLQIFFL